MTMDELREMARESREKREAEQAKPLEPGDVVVHKGDEMKRTMVVIEMGRAAFEVTPKADQDRPDMVAVRTLGGDLVPRDRVFHRTELKKV